MKRSPKLEPTYFRLCHRCSHLNESDVEVVKCERCNMALATSKTPRAVEPDPRRGVWSDEDDDLEDDSARRAPPLAGLSAIF